MLVVDDTVDGKDNLLEETMEDGDIMMYPLCWRPSPLSSL